MASSCYLVKLHPKPLVGRNSDLEHFDPLDVEKDLGMGDRGRGNRYE